MFRIQKILYPIDFSRGCLTAAPQAAGLARSQGAEIVALHIAPPKGDSKAPAEELRAFRQSELPDLPVQTVVERGDAAEVITRFAGDADLLVLPTYGDGRLRRLLLGSVASSVLRHAPCPVWAVVPHACRSIVSEGPVLCAAPLSEETPSVLQFAREAASVFRRPLAVVHAAERLDAVESSRSLLAQWMLPDEELSVEFGNVERIVRHEVERLSPAMLVVGRGRHPGWVGQDAYAIVRESCCPVLSPAATQIAALRHAA